tara:strand:- start:1501 stop:2040 length:540 start_codon:yes stop_codon:yes gene_type:complete
MSEYKNAKIYKITDINNEMVYIGSTTQPLIYRMRVHLSKYLHKDKYLYGGSSVNKIFDKYGIDKCSIQLIQEYPCRNKTDLLKKEGSIIMAMKNTTQIIVNKNIAGRVRTPAELKEYYRQWEIANKDYRKEYKKNYNKISYEKKKELKKQLEEESNKQIQICIDIIDNTPDNPLDIVII